MFDHSWSGRDSFGCFCFGGFAQKTKFKRFPEIFPPRTFFFVYCVSKKHFLFRALLNIHNKNFALCNAMPFLKYKALYRM